MAYALKSRARIHPAVKDAACGAIAISIGVFALCIIVTLIAPFMSAAAGGLLDLGR